MKGSDVNKINCQKNIMKFGVKSKTLLLKRLDDPDKEQISITMFKAQSTF